MNSLINMLRAACGTEMGLVVCGIVVGLVLVLGLASEGKHAEPYFSVFGSLYIYVIVLGLFLLKFWKETYGADL